MYQTVWIYVRDIDQHIFGLCKVPPVLVSIKLRLEPRDLVNEAIFLFEETLHVLGRPLAAPVAVLALLRLILWNQCP